MPSSCTCFIIPNDVLERLASDKRFHSSVRKSASDSARISDAIRNLRMQHGFISSLGQAAGAHLEDLVPSPQVTVYDCRNTQSVPGIQIKPTKNSQDHSAWQCINNTKNVAKFYKTVFGRNSIDDAGMTMLSSIHFGKSYNNAMWNGQQMIFGDGDGKIFLDFTQNHDVIGHELTHGVTQHSLQLGYSGDAGALNESISDCFGSMFHQWMTKQDVNTADWLIGAGIMGDAAKSKGYKCLRNMANPADKSALTPQPANYLQITKGMDPHYGSGPPNFAFYTACKILGGKSWEAIGQVWYLVLTTSGAQPEMTIPQFAARCRQVASQYFSKHTSVKAAVDAGWKKIGV